MNYILRRWEHGGETEEPTRMQFDSIKGALEMLQYEAEFTPQNVYDILDSTGYMVCYFNLNAAEVRIKDA